MTTAFGPGHTSAQHSFATLPQVNIQRSTFNRSHGLKTSFDAGLLIPIFADEALPGDTLSMSVSSFVRMATPAYPVMDNIWMDFFFFAVPCRLLWDNWQKMNGEQENPTDSTDFLVPTITETVLENTLSDYLGIPVNTTAPIEFSAFWHRAYNLIYKEWFRSQDLMGSPPINRGDGPDDPADYQLLRRTKRHDYFSSCLPWPQKGAAVEIPFADWCAVVPVGPNAAPLFKFADGGGGQSFLASPGNNNTTIWATPPGAPSNASWVSSGLQADLSTAAAVTINQLREAFAIQVLLERDARSGTRYTEVLRGHFGVTSPDGRVQRPEYLGGGSTRINMHPVARTTPLEGDQAQGALAELGAFATASAHGIGFVKSFTEHCVVLGLVNVRADLTYQQGLHRMFSRRTRFDFYWPELAHLGEQPVLQKEIYATGTPAEDDIVFGYQERWAEYRYKPSIVTGMMRSQSSQPLDVWHLALDFQAAPLLNAAFIADSPPIDRVLTVSGASVPQFFGDFFFKYRTARPMPTYSVPGLINHF